MCTEAGSEAKRGSSWYEVRIGAECRNPGRAKAIAKKENKTNWNKIIVMIWCIFVNVFLV